MGRPSSPISIPLLKRAFPPEGAEVYAQNDEKESLRTGGVLCIGGLAQGCSLFWGSLFSLSFLLFGEAAAQLPVFEGVSPSGVALDLPVGKWRIFGSDPGLSVVGLADLAQVIGGLNFSLGHSVQGPVLLGTSSGRARLDRGLLFVGFHLLFAVGLDLVGLSQ